MKNYLDYFQEGGKSPYYIYNRSNNSSVLKPKEFIAFEYLKDFVDKIKHYVNVRNRTKEILPKNNQTTPGVTREQAAIGAAMASIGLWTDPFESSRNNSNSNNSSRF